MRVSVAVQHHPARAHLLPGLIQRLGGDVEVVTDPEPDATLPSPLRTYRLALELTPGWATHRLVVQDDARPCDQFHERMMEAIAEHPDELVALFVPGIAPHRAKMMRAMLRQERWAWLRGGWYPVVALCWPARLAREFAEWSRDRLHPTLGEKYRGDDGQVGAFAGQRRLRVWATVPSLVEHPDVEPSLIGKPNRAGRNKGRVAAIYQD